MAVMFPLSPVGTAPQKTQLPWDAGEAVPGARVSHDRGEPGRDASARTRARARPAELTWWRASRRGSRPWPRSAPPSATWRGRSRPAAAEKRIPLAAKKFEFSVTEIRTRVGVPVTLVLSSADFVHGFAIPDLDVRIDLVPGQDRRAHAHARPRGPLRLPVRQLLRRGARGDERRARGHWGLIRGHRHGARSRIAALPKYKCLRRREVRA